jgi:hypothetical protein
MAEAHNVGVLDRYVRLTLGVACVGALGYHFFVAPILNLIGIIALVVLIPFFLKTGLTRVCPVMKAMGISTNRP